MKLGRQVVVVASSSLHTRRLAKWWINTFANAFMSWRVVVVVVVVDYVGRRRRRTAVMIAAFSSTSTSVPLVDFSLVKMIRRLE